MMRRITYPITVFVLLLTGTYSFAQSREVPYTLEDRDSMILILEKLNSQQQQINDLKESFQKQFNGMQQQITDLKESNQKQFIGFQQQINDLKESNQKQFDAMQQQINDLRGLFYWGFGILISLIMFLFGFIIWDRRTVTEPIREKLQIIIQALREYAKEQPKLSEILRSHGVL